MRGNLRIEGYAIASADGMIADATGYMPNSLKFEADQRFFLESLDRVQVVCHGRLSHEGDAEFAHAPPPDSHPASARSCARSRQSEHLALEPCRRDIGRGVRCGRMRGRHTGDRRRNGCLQPVSHDWLRCLLSCAGRAGVSAWRRARLPRRSARAVARRRSSRRGVEAGRKPSAAARGVARQMDEAPARVAGRELRALSDRPPFRPPPFNSPLFPTRKHAGTSHSAGLQRCFHG